MPCDPSSPVTSRICLVDLTLLSKIKMFNIEFTQSAQDDLSWFKKSEQNIIINGIFDKLRYEPTIETKNCFQLRSNSTADWELRIQGKFRVLYNVDDQVEIVEVQKIGEKRGNRIFFRGQEGNL